MRKKIIEHLVSIVVIGAIFISVGYYLTSKSMPGPVSETSKPNFAYVNLNDPLERTILEESLRFFYPQTTIRMDELQKIYAGRDLENIIFKKEHRTLNWQNITSISYMYIKFILIYLFVLILTYYGAQSLAIFKFVKDKQKRSSYIMMLRYQIFHAPKKSTRLISVLLIKAIAKGIILFTLFSPAYVIAYSIRTSFDTNSVFFMILLGILSNGLLISYTQKFYTFLNAESRKGYVQTARVKNLSQDYSRNHTSGIPYRRIFAPVKYFTGHVFDHIYMNARFQYLSSLKEQASFLISGLVIIEMALNIQGHICYELLQNILYENYQIVLLIVFLIFLLLKVTEIFCDYLVWFQTKKYGNIIQTDE